MPQFAPNNISIINASTVLTDAEIRPVVEALQKQVSNDFRPAWGVDAKLNFVGNAPPPDGTWWLAILDDSDQGARWVTTISLPTVCPLAKCSPGPT
jgi:hypothetical protein